MRICLVTPWPPQHTGIADYAYDLAWGLHAERHEVVVVTDAPDSVPLHGVTLQSPAWLTDETAAGFDRIVYQMGNNTDFHIFQLPLLFRHSGVVHLHDMVCHHLMAWLLYVQGTPEFYRKVLAKWYGPLLAEWSWRELMRNQPIWETSLVSEVPLFEEIAQHATACVTHSTYAARKLNAAFRSMKVKVLPQLYREASAHHGGAEGPFRIGVFGGVDPNKRVDYVLRSCLACIEAGRSLELHIVGKIHPACEQMLLNAQQSPLKDAIRIHGRVEHGTLLELLAEMDLCVALRYPTMGETSAVVMRALQAGTPVMVNDIGWYAELPDFLPKIQPGVANEQQDLTNAIMVFSARGPEYRSLLAKTQHWVGRTLQFNDAVRDYAQFLQTC